MGQPMHASWSRLPAPVAERIVRQAFRDSGREVLQWLRLSLVCRDWRKTMSKKPADLVLTRRKPGPLMTSSDQVAWLHLMRVPLRSITIELSLVSGGHTCSVRTASTELAVSADMLAASTPYLLEVHGLMVEPPMSRHVTTLGRFTALRCLTLSCWDHLYPDEAQELLESLPKSLESLQLHGMDLVEGSSFACLPRLRQLRMNVGSTLCRPKRKKSPEYGEVGVELAGLPAGLETLEVLAEQKCLYVRLAAGPPTALLRLEAADVELQEEGGWGGRGTGSGNLSVRLLEVIMCGFTLCMHRPPPAWEEYAEYANAAYSSSEGPAKDSDDLGVRRLQSSPCVGDCLAEWIARSDMSAVHLNVRVDYAYANKGRFEMCVRNLDDERTSHTASIQVGTTGEELLNTFQGPCQKRGIRCTDADAPGPLGGELIRFERI